MHILFALFGDPSDVAAQHALKLKAYQLMASWLRVGEAMMRRLLLIEAAAFAKPNSRPLLREPRPRTRKLMHFFPETPEKWRVSFCCFATPRGLSSSKAGATATALRQAQGSNGRRPFIIREEPALRSRHANRAQRRSSHRKRYAPILRQDRECIIHRPPMIFRSAWPLAERYEALLRAFNDPLPYARRLSRKLHAASHRVDELFATPPEARHRIDRYAELTAAAEASAAVFNSS